MVLLSAAVGSSLQAAAAPRDQLAGSLVAEPAVGWSVGRSIPDGVLLRCLRPDSQISTSFLRAVTALVACGDLELGGGFTGVRSLEYVVVCWLYGSRS